MANFWRSVGAVWIRRCCLIAHFLAAGSDLFATMAPQGDGLVANDAGRAIRRRRKDALSIDVRLGTRDEEGPGLVQHIKAGKVDVATIHDVDGSGFRQEHIEGMNVVQRHPRCG